MNRTSIVLLAFAAGAVAGPSVYHGMHAEAPGSGLVPFQGKRLRSQPLPGNVPAVRITPIVRAVRKASPSVVNIQVGTAVQGRRGQQFNKLGDGSGVIVSSEGLVLTNWHVVRYFDRVQNFRCRVSLRDGRQHPAKVVNTSRENDLALLLVTPADGLKHSFPPIEMGNSETLMVGETVVAIGNPRGQANTVTSGVLSAVNRSMAVTPQGERRPIVFDTLLQTDAAINPGNSGGALLDLTGRLIGINTLMQLQSENIGFAIPVNKVRRVFESDLLNVSRLSIWIGFDVKETKDGLVTDGVVRGGPADKAGIRNGDRVLQVGNRKVNSAKDFAKALVTWTAGQRVPFYISRNASTKWHEVRGWTRSEAAVYQFIGVTLDEVDVRREYQLFRSVYDELYQTYGYDGGRFDLLRVVGVQRDSPAAELGLKPGDLLIGTIYRDTWLNPFTSGTRELSTLLQQSRGKAGPKVSVFRKGEGLLSGRISVR